MMTFSLMEGLYIALDFNLNLFRGSMLLFLTKILYLEASYSKDIEIGVMISRVCSLGCTGSIIPLLF
jgi:hypothetical protein